MMPLWCRFMARCACSGQQQMTQRMVEADSYKRELSMASRVQASLFLSRNMTLFTASIFPKASPAIYMIM